VATPRTTFTLAVLVILGLGYLYFFERKLETTDEHAVSERHILHLHADQVVSMAMRRDAWTYGTVERIDGATWKRTQPVAGAVDSAAVGELLSELEFGEHRTTLEGHGNDTQHLYEEGLAPPHLSVTLTLADRREIEFEVGKETPTADGVYVHVRDATQVQVVDPKLRDGLDLLLNSLSDTTGANAADGAAKPDTTAKPDDAKADAHGSD
jgi:hypothetical protein